GTALANLCDALAALGRTKEALDMGVRLTAFEGRDPEAWARRARLALASGDGKDALSAIGKAIGLAPARADLLRLKRDLLAAQRAHKAVVEVNERLLELDPKDVDALRSIATAYEALGKGDAAMESLEHAARIDPMDRATWNAKGAFLARVGRRAEALAAYDHT